MWFGTLQSLVVETYIKYGSNFGVADNVDNQTQTHAKQHLTPFCNNTDNKRPIEWYLSNVALDMLTPPVDSIAFGLLWVKSDWCGRLLNDSGRIVLGTCRPQMYGKPPDSMIFQLTREGHLKITGEVHVLFIYQFV